MSDGYGNGPPFPPPEKPTTPGKLRELAASYEKTVPSVRVYSEMGNALRSAADQMEAYATRLYDFEALIHDARRAINVPELKLTLIGADLVRRIDAVLSDATLASELKLAYDARNAAQERANAANRRHEELMEAAQAVMPFLEKGSQVVHAFFSTKSEGDKLREQAARADAKDAAVGTLKAILYKHAHR